MGKSTVISGVLRRDARLLVLDVDGGEQLVLGPASLCGPDLDLRGPGKVRVNVSGKRHPGSCTCLGKHGLPHLELDWMRVEGVPLPEPCEVAPSCAADVLQSFAAADATSECSTWREWAAKILAAYPWVDEFKPEDSDEKYRDGVRYVLLSIECNGSGSEADNQEMKTIRDRWGFS